MKLTQIFTTALILTLSLSAFAKPLKVVTSTTDLAWAMKEIGGENVEVTALLKGTENPHYSDAVPEFIRLVAEADVVCVVGLELEVGWVPKVLARSGNAKVQPGGNGYCEAGKGISVLEKPTGGVDRSMGDVHPAGNPHFWLSPKAFSAASVVLAQTLMGVDSPRAAIYQEGLKKLQAKLEAIHQRNAEKLKPVLAGLKQPAIIEYHKEFAYFWDTYGIQSFGSVEEKPGIAPSAGRIAEVALAAKAAGVKLVVAADTAPKNTLEKFKEVSGIPVVQVPMSLNAKSKLMDYEAFENYVVDAIIKGLQAPKS